LGDSIFLSRREQLKIAQRFNAGSSEGNYRSPGGTTDHRHAGRIFKRPSGTKIDSRCRTTFGSIFVAVMVLCVFSAVQALAQSCSLKSDETVVLYPALAWRSGEALELDLHGIVYEPEQRRLTMRAIRKIIGIDEETLTTSEKAVFQERCLYFLVDNERGKKFTTTVGNETFALGTSEASGHFNSRQRWKTNDVIREAVATNGALMMPLTLNGIDGRRASLKIHLLEETGLSVISDIDDTIKISEVLDREALLKNTFVRPFKPVLGMAGTYRLWSEELGAQFHYVTSSPWQLYLPLSEFTRSNGFPAGTFHMKQFRVKDRSVLALLGSPERYKLGVIEPLLRQFPKRQFVLVGDSGEKDPEIYGTTARKYPNQIKRILIRDVTSENSDAPRYQKAFRGVPEEIWQVFSSPGEIKDVRAWLR